MIMGRAAEIAAVIGTVGLLAGTPAAIWAFGKDRAPESGGRVIVLTGVQRDGVWTDENVTAASFGVTRYRAATIELREDEKVTLRLSSADVLHSFYIPELGVGPIDVKPGVMTDVAIENPKPGVYTYYCTSVCGACHYFMRGTVRVADASGVVPPDTRPEPLGCDARGDETTAARPALERAARLYRERGCVACHGDRGAGGVANPNSLNGEVPRLDTMAERFMLFEPEDADAAIDLILSGADIAADPAEAPWPRYAVFQAQFQATVQLIRDGNRAGKKNEAGAEPPLHMPRWAEVVGPEDRRLLVAYFLSLYDWEAEDDEDDEDDEEDEED
jgi:mono/diheme cytochrome c family protein